MHDTPNIIVLIVAVYTIVIAVWLSPVRISALLIKISSRVKKTQTSSFLIVGICIWILAVHIENNQLKNRLISIDAKLDEMGAFAISQNMEIKQNAKDFKNLLESEILVSKAGRIKLQQMHNKILRKMRDTDEVLEDLVQSTREIERKVKNGQAVFRHLKDYMREQEDKNYQFEDDLHTLQQLYKRIQQERENEYRSQQERENEYRFHKERENERQRGVAKKPNMVVQILDKVINVAVNTVGRYVGGAIFEAISWVGSWLGIT